MYSCVIELNSHIYLKTTLCCEYKDVLFPTLSDAEIVNEKQFDDIARVCRSLYQTKPELKSQAYVGHLHRANSLEGLLLSTSQMMIRGGGKENLPSGDLLRMANNIIKLRELKSKHDNKNHPFALLTVSMDDFIAAPSKFTFDCLNFLLGKNRGLICPDKSCKHEIERIADEFEQSYIRKQTMGSSHITTGKHSNVTKKYLLEAVKNNTIFGPVLNEIESLVNQALNE